MIEVIIDDSRLKSIDRSKSKLGQDIACTYRMQDAELHKLFLLSFIKKHAFNIDIREKQYIFIKPCKTSNKFIYDLHGVSNMALKSLIQQHLLHK
jgi:hypothetical protein